MDEMTPQAERDAGWDAETYVCGDELNGVVCGNRVHVNDNPKWHSLRHHFDMPADDIPVPIHKFYEGDAGDETN